jgi:nucleoside-diphosphate-sugar epimerase
VQAACDAVKLAARLGCKRFVNAGSIMEYEAMSYIPQAGATPGMGNIYSTAKLAADFMAKTTAAKEHIEYCNVIISNIYGIGEKSGRFLNSVMRKMLQNESIAMTQGTQLYDFIYVTDAVKAIILAGINGEANTSYYIGNETQRPLREFVLDMKEILQSKSELLFGRVPFTGAMLSYREFDTEGLKTLGFRPEISFKEGIKKTQEWIKEEESEF